MGDDHSCKVEEIGTVSVKMFNEMVREPKEARYVPQVRKNLISVVPWKHWVMEYLLEMIFSR